MGEVTPRVRKSPFIGGFSESHSVMSNSLWPHELYSPWNTPGQNTGEGSLSLLQGIFPTQGSNPGLPHCSQILYQLSHQGSLGGFSGRNRSLAQPLPGFILWTICPLECPSSLLLGPPLCLPLLSWALKKMMGMFTAEVSIRKLLGHQRSTFQFSLYQKQFLLPSHFKILNFNRRTSFLLPHISGIFFACLLVFYFFIWNSVNKICKSRTI